MELILALILLVVIVVVFIIYPLILLIQSLFDSNVSAGTKILIFLSTLFVFPIPSFCYGAFVKNSGLSKFILAIYVILFVLAIVFMLFFGGAAIVAGYMGSEGFSIEQMIDGQGLPEVETNAEPEYKGYNTYGTDEVNVFESSGPDDEPIIEDPPPQPAIPQAPAQEQP